MTRYRKCDICRIRKIKVGSANCVRFTYKLRLLSATRRSHYAVLVGEAGGSVHTALRSKARSIWLLDLSMSI